MHTRQIGQMGGLWQTAPALSGAGLFFVMASIGLPGLGDFVGEFLVLFGAYSAHISLTVLATLGIIGATLYGLKITSQVLYGPNRHRWTLPDLAPREWAILGPMMLVLLWVGLYPQRIIRLFRPENPAPSIAFLQPAAHLNPAKEVRQ